MRLPAKYEEVASGPGQGARVAGWVSSLSDM